ncbi:MAG: hypothetical protein HOE44_06580 [Candidatus Marinimicrobia bacterium]|nr:hypothetical protein [Candidatus Neomarinimicrobiota bacterium]
MMLSKNTMLSNYSRSSRRVLRLHSGEAPSRSSSRAESRDNHRSWYLPIFILALFMFSCDLPHQPGPMPTDIVETEFQAGLNILGVLRADDQAGTSFININRALTTEEIYSDSIENFSPQVDYVKVSSIISSSEHLFMRDEDTSDWGDYRDTTLNVEAGEAFDLEVKAPGFPTLTGQTIIPDKPQLIPNSLLMNSDKLSFQIQHHPSTYEYKLYLFFAGNVLDKIVKPSNGSSIEVDWSFSTSNGVPLYLMLTALDENLTRYGNSPISFIPNTYHPDGSTVEGGYGCFGSVAVTIIEL